MASQGTLIVDLEISGDMGFNESRIHGIRYILLCLASQNRYLDILFHARNRFIDLYFLVISKSRKKLP